MSVEQESEEKREEPPALEVVEDPISNSMMADHHAVAPVPVPVPLPVTKEELAALDKLLGPDDKSSERPSELSKWASVSPEKVGLSRPRASSALDTGNDRAWRFTPPVFYPPPEGRRARSSGKAVVYHGRENYLNPPPAKIIYGRPAVVLSTPSLATNTSTVVTVPESTGKGTETGEETKRSIDNAPGQAGRAAPVLFPLSDSEEEEWDDVDPMVHYSLRRSPAEGHAMQRLRRRRNANSPSTSTITQSHGSSISGRVAETVGARSDGNGRELVGAGVRTTALSLKGTPTRNILERKAYLRRMQDLRMKLSPGAS